MILPIIKYGNPILRQKSKEITPDYPNLDILIKNMFETLNMVGGVGLAAPQIGLNIRLFIVDYMLMKRVFINPTIHKESGEYVEEIEGCLSIPKLSAPVRRHDGINISFYDKDFMFHKKRYTGYKSRIIQHEYDHLEGIMYVDRVNNQNYIKPFLDEFIKIH